MSEMSGIIKDLDLAEDEEEQLKFKIKLVEVKYEWSEI
jgi:hypothetical protein